MTKKSWKIIFSKHRQPLKFIASNAKSTTIFTTVFSATYYLRLVKPYAIRYTSKWSTYCKVLIQKKPGNSGLFFYMLFMLFRCRLYSHVNIYL